VQKGFAETKQYEAH